MNSYNALNSLSKKIGIVGLRLSTGIRLNSAGDDPASFTIARKMQARTRAIAQAVNNVGDAKSVLSIAEGGLISISDIMLTIKEKISQATNGTFGTDELTAVVTQVNDYLNEVDDIIMQTKFSNNKLLSNNFTQKAFQIGPDAEDIITVDIKTPLSSSDFKLGDLDDDAKAIVFERAAISAAIENGEYGDAAYQTDGKFDPAKYIDAGKDIGIGDEDTLASIEIENVTSFIPLVDYALNVISMQIQYVGSLSNRLDFKEDMLNISKTNVDAAISRMYDADLAKEQMQMVKLQILQTTATAQLAQANAAPQLYLQLFQ
jgi:flagellin